MTLVGVPALAQHVALGLAVLFGALSGWNGILLACTQIIGSSQLFALDSAGRWLSLLLLGVASLRAPARVPVTIFVWLGYVLLDSALFSVWPDLSTSKALSLIVAIVTIARLSSLESRQRKSDVLDVWFGALACCSLALIAVGAGTGRGGLTGVTGHSQLLGLFAALSFVWSVNGLIQGASRVRWVQVTAVVSFGLLILSASRTAVLSSFGGVLLGVLSAWLGAGQAARGQRSRIAANAGRVLVLVVLVIALFGAERIESFLQKGKEVELDPVSLILEARGGQMEASLRNWELQPLFGIGLGVPSYFDVPGARDAIQYVGPIPVSLSVEKGFGLTAVLEELGIMGSILTWGGLAILVLGALRIAGMRYAGLATTAILSNAGDFVLLSAGGSGLLVWACILAFLGRGQDRVRSAPAGAPEQHGAT